MGDDYYVQVNINGEVDRYFDDSSIVTSGQPEIIVIMGAMAVGKT